MYRGSPMTLVNSPLSHMLALALSFLGNMDFLDRSISETFKIRTKKDKEAVLKRVHKFKVKEELEEFEIKEDEIAMLRSPTGLAPFRGYGRIKVSLKSHKDETLIVCQIQPYDNYFTIIVFIVITLMILWAIASYMISSSRGFLIMIVGWSMTIIGVVSYLFLNRFLLRVFAKYFIRKITE